MNKFNHVPMLGVTILAVTLLSSGLLAALAQPPEVGVLIVAHGAPWEQWNKLPRALATEVQDKLAQADNAMIAQVAFLEFATPSVAEGVAELEAKGVQQIVAVPIFITQSTHTLFDLPCVLGTLYHPETMEVLEDEGASIVRTGTPIILATTLCCSGLLPKIMLQRAQAISTNPREEAVVVFAHGSRTFAWPWRKNLRKVTKALREEGGFASADYAFVGVGHGPSATRTVVSAINRAAEHGDRVLVLGLYVAMGTDSLLEGCREKLPVGLEVIASQQGVLPHPAVADWVVSIAEKAATARSGNGRGGR